MNQRQSPRHVADNVYVVFAEEVIMYHHARIARKVRRYIRYGENMRRQRDTGPLFNDASRWCYMSREKSEMGAILMSSRAIIYIISSLVCGEAYSLWRYLKPSADSCCFCSRGILIRYFACVAFRLSVLHLRCSRVAFGALTVNIL